MFFLLSFTPWLDPLCLSLSSHFLWSDLWQPNLESELTAALSDLSLHANLYVYFYSMDVAPYQELSTVELVNYVAFIFWLSLALQQFMKVCQ